MTAPDAGAYPRRRPKISHGASAVVTGAGSGIGRAFAETLASRGGRVVCADIDLTRAQETVDIIGGGKARAVACDVTSYEQVSALATVSEEWLRQPADLVINNAGIGTGGLPVGTMSMADWESTLAINLWGVIYGCQVFTPILREQRFGGIINVASAASFAAAPMMAAYNVSKAGVLALSETLSAELSGSGIKVTVLCPTFVKTNIVADGRIPGSTGSLAASVMKYTGVSPERIARGTLDAHDRGRFYVVPQLDAKLVWQLKRHAPNPYRWGAGLIGRMLPTPVDARELLEPEVR
ncbi:SDR family NAD(P)-dependent oxidoreductase [Mycobacterium sp. CBMA271]|uniref:SDR family NAD(P)-dependent oxidoreductase n=1 Tax=unclassified Mycobacteroides TaxID=2618759 RepID=UPI0012DE949B|nr:MULTISPECIES: SDR family NAD(P)-dependent oxidoreductase [unclassified Mycobacteroides]MUM19755.1 short-chain dehydrogenase [Mycobacteroides sp. CBMA 326]MUM21089.1 SDR family NAD(P)-dependent oxidoreductase [Mycobacteroides sp. CBMA 271]